jgi:hypothetical protein
LTPIDVYRVGLGDALRALRGQLRRGDWGRAWRNVVYMRRQVWRRSFWGFWQAEWPGCQQAVRGFTEASCRRRAVSVFNREQAGVGFQRW